MFKLLANKISTTLRNIAGIGAINESNISKAAEDIRKALINADVSLSVVDALIDQVKKQAIGTDKIKGITHGNQFTKIVNDALIKTMSHPQKSLKILQKKPMVIALAGLQGAGKTTTCIKLALWLKAQHHLTVHVASADCHRPAAIDQLEHTAQDENVAFIDTRSFKDALSMAQGALNAARQSHADVLIVDMAGRHEVDQNLMDEARGIVKKAHVDQVLFVIDSMLGQSAAGVAKAFHESLPLSGIILTKMDADAKGGAALSASQITQLPILFVGTGEKPQDLDTFNPERIASRILDMGDIVSLVEEAKRHVSDKEAKKTARKIQSGQFDFNDFLSQLQQINSMGGIMSILDRLPGAASLPQKALDMVDEKEFKRTEAAILSMTPHERAFPEHMKQPSRIHRVSNGSGIDETELKKILKKFEKMRKMMKKFSPGKMQKMMGQFQNHMK
ncbi:signal recognition particle protein Srp54 [Gammaproteobacteria bacterium]|nr:signal recognition particle protein Srp54 [Gammaproteobacteria bacterium]